MKYKQEGFPYFQGIFSQFPSIYCIRKFRAIREAMEILLASVLFPSFLLLPTFALISVRHPTSAGIWVLQLLSLLRDTYARSRNMFLSEKSV